MYEDFLQQFIRAALAGRVDEVATLLADRHATQLIAEHHFGDFLYRRSLPIPVVRHILADPRVDPSGWYNGAIGWAVTHKQVDLVETLLADPRVDPTEDEELLSRAIEPYASPDIIEMLLEDARIDPDLALYTAIQQGESGIVARLLADPRVHPVDAIREYIGSAISSGYAETVQLLLADPRGDPIPSCHKAMQRTEPYGSAHTIQVLLADPRIDPGILKNAPICLAAENGYVKAVRLLLMDPRVSPRGRDDASALCMACSARTRRPFGCYEDSRNYWLTTKLLLADPRVDPTRNDNAALARATESGRTDIVKLLLHRHGVRTTSGRFRRLSIAQLMLSLRLARCRRVTTSSRRCTGLGSRELLSVLQHNTASQ